MFVLPKGDLKIIDPARMDALPPEGRNVGDDNAAYWNRHLNDDSIEVLPADKVDAAVARLERADAQRADAAAKAAVPQPTKPPAPTPAAPAPQK